MGQPGCSGIIQEDIDRVVIVFMVQHAEPTTVYETAQWQYDNVLRYEMDGSYEEYRNYVNNEHAYGYVRRSPPLCLWMNTVLFKNKHHFKVHFFGLDNDPQSPTYGQISPYITDNPNGYFNRITPSQINTWVPNQTCYYKLLYRYNNGIYVSMTTHTASITSPPGIGTQYQYIIPSSELANNNNGWDTPMTGRARLNALQSEIFHSQYFNDYYDPSIIYNKNVSHRIDYALIATPEHIGFSLYAQDTFSHMVAVLPIANPVIPEISEASIQPAVGNNTYTLVHEYTHHAFADLYFNAYGRTGVDRRMPDLYWNGSYGRTAPQPIADKPIHKRCVQAVSQYNYMISPMILSAFGITNLDREVTESGIYEIGNRIDSYDAVVIRSRYDKFTYCILTHDIIDDAMVPSPYLATEFASRHGINAYFICLKVENGKWSFNNYSGMPYGCYASWEMTAEHDYQDLNNDLYDGTRLKRRSLLTDFVTPSGITASYLGSRIDESGVSYAQVQINIEGDGGYPIPEFTITYLSAGGGYSRLMVNEYAYVPNCDVLIVRWSWDPGMEGAYEYDISDLTVYGLTYYNADMALDVLTYQAPIAISNSSQRPRYVQLIATGSSNTIESNISQLPMSHPIGAPVPPPTTIDILSRSIKVNIVTDYRKTLGPVFGYHIVCTLNGAIISDIATELFDYTGYGNEDKYYSIIIDNLIPHETYDIDVSYYFGDWEGPARTLTATVWALVATLAIDSANTAFADTISIHHNQDADATDYEFEIVCDGDTTTQILPIASYDENGYVDIDCPYPGQTAQVRVRATDGEYFGEYSASYNVVMPAMTAPIIHTCKLVDNTDIYLAWDMPVNIHTVDAYIVEYSYDNFTTIDGSETVALPEYTMPDMPPETIVYWRVCAVLGAYNSPNSIVQQITTLISEAPYIQSVIRSYTSTIIEHDVVLGWEYELEYTNNNETTTLFLQSDEYVDNTYEIKDMQPLESYAIRVRRHDPEGEWSEIYYAGKLLLPGVANVSINLVEQVSAYPLTFMLDIEWPLVTTFPDITYDISIEQVDGSLHIAIASLQTDKEKISWDAGNYTLKHLRACVATRYDNYDSGAQTISPTVLIDSDKHIPYATAIIAEHETAKIKHILYNNLYGYTIVIASETGDIVEYDTALEDYDAEGYYALPAGSLMSGTHYDVTIIADAPARASQHSFETLHMYPPSILSYTAITSSGCEIDIIQSGAVEDEQIMVTVYTDEEMTQEFQQSTYAPSNHLVLSGLNPDTEYYLQLTTFKDYGDTRKYAYYSTYDTIKTFQQALPVENIEEPEVMIENAYAEYKSTNVIMVTWDTVPHKINMPYQIWRRLITGGRYEIVGNGIGNAFIDDIAPVGDNEFIEYKIQTGGSMAEIQMYRQGDAWVLGMSADYLWQLNNAYNSSIAVAYCLAKSSANCPECFSEELNKITKSKCSTCDGSGKLVSYVGPIPFKYAPMRYTRDMDNVGNVERDKEMVAAWTANIPIFNIGDLVINKDHKKFMIQSIPNRIFVHSATTNDECIVRQDIILRKLDDDEYPQLTYYENKASNYVT